jgi:hypothetical protein
MRVLVCGGRSYDDRNALWRALDTAHSKRPITLVIHGDAGKVDPETGRVICGADKLSGVWADARGIQVKAIAADWKGRGRKAGPERNQRMLNELKPEGVIALPGAIGTADMCARAEAAGIPVWRPYG